MVGTEKQPPVEGITPAVTENGSCLAGDQPGGGQIVGRVV